MDRKALATLRNILLKKSQNIIFIWSYAQQRRKTLATLKHSKEKKIPKFCIIFIWSYAQQQVKKIMLLKQIQLFKKGFVIFLHGALFWDFFFTLDG